MPGETVAAYVARRTGATAATAAMEAAADALGLGDPGGRRRLRRGLRPLAGHAAPPTWTSASPAVLADLGLDVGPDAA